MANDKTNNTQDNGLRVSVQAILEGVTPGETRVSYPSGESKIFDNLQLLEDDLMELFEKHTDAIVEQVIGGEDPWNWSQNEMRDEQRQRYQRIKEELL